MIVLLVSASAFAADASGEILQFLLPFLVPSTLPNLFDAFRNAFALVICSGGGRDELVRVRARGGADPPEGPPRRVQVLHRRVEHQRGALLGRESLLLLLLFFLLFQISITDLSWWSRSKFLLISVVGRLHGGARLRDGGGLVRGVRHCAVPRRLLLLLLPRAGQVLLPRLPGPLPRAARRRHRRRRVITPPLAAQHRRLLPRSTS
jgi:hypothetical protein